MKLQSETLALENKKLTRENMKKASELSALKSYSR